MRRITVILLALLTSLVFVSPVAAAPSIAGHSPGGSRFTVTGAVATPATYRASDLATMPQVSLPARHGRTVTGVTLQGLTDLSTPQPDSLKNGVLRETITVSGRSGTVGFSAGELDAGFGNHPALLVRRGSRVDLVVPGDRSEVRSVTRVDAIRVGIARSDAIAAPAAGSVMVVDRSNRQRVVSAVTLAHLPQQTRTVSYLSGTSGQTHTESGPSLTTVLRIAGVKPSRNTAVTAVATDGYAATVTLGEQYVGGRPLMLSLREDGTALDRPRLVTAGDVKGGRYISGVITLRVWRLG